MDCANGVGAPKMAGLLAALGAAGAPLAADLRNTGDGVLNGGCGSDFLQKDRQLPANFGGVPAGARCCAVDGDADRLMYFTPLQGGSHGAHGWLPAGLPPLPGPRACGSAAVCLRQHLHAAWACLLSCSSHPISHPPIACSTHPPARPPARSPAVRRRPHRLPGRHAGQGPDQPAAGGRRWRRPGRAQRGHHPDRLRQRRRQPVHSGAPGVRRGGDPHGRQVPARGGAPLRRGRLL